MRRVWLLVLASALFASACGGGDGPRLDEGAAREVDTSTSTPADDAGTGVVLRLAVPDDWSDDPADAGPSTLTNRVIADLLYEGLVSVDAAGVAQPALADRWFVDDDRTTWTFVLGAAVVDGSGEFVTARDVKLSLERIAARGPADQAALALTAIRGWENRMSGTTGGVAGISAPDSTTLVIRLDHPFEPLLGVLADPAYGVTGVGESGTLRTTGDFRRTDDPAVFASVDPDAAVASIELVRSPEGPAAAMAAGDADWAVLPVGAGTEGLPADVFRQPLDLRVAVVTRRADVAERRGITQALEPLLLASAASDVLGRPAPDITAEGTVPDSVTVVAPNGPLASVGTEIAAQLRAAGVDVDDSTLAPEPFARQVANGSAVVFPVVVAGPLGLVRLAEPGSADDVFGSDSDARAELVAAIHAEPDPNQRALFVEALERSLINDGFLLPVGRYEVRVAFGDRLDGFRARADGTLDVSSVGLAS